MLKFADRMGRARCSGSQGASQSKASESNDPPISGPAPKSEGAEGADSMKISRLFLLQRGVTQQPNELEWPRSEPSNWWFLSVFFPWEPRLSPNGICYTAALNALGDPDPDASDGRWRATLQLLSEMWRKQLQPEAAAAVQAVQAGRLCTVAVGKHFTCLLLVV